MAPKKSGFKAKATDTKNIYDALATGNTKDIESTENTQNTKNAKEYYRFNLKLPLYQKDFLAEQVYKMSSPEHMWTITEYITHVIDEDMKKNGK